MLDGTIEAKRRRGRKLLKFMDNVESVYKRTKQ